MYFIFKFADSNSLDFIVDLRSITTNFPKQMAYVSHMFVIGLIYAIVAPAVNVIIFVTFFMEVCSDRYFILYIYMPMSYADMSAQMNLLVKVIGNIFLGLIFMLVSTACYMLVQGSEIYYFGIVVCILCLIWAIYTKMDTDADFRRSLNELARGDFEDASVLQINPAHIDSVYDDSDNFLSCFDCNNPE